MPTFWNTTLLYEALTDHKAVHSKLVHTVPHERFALIPSNYQMALIEQKLFMTRNREHKLKELIEGVCGQYDFVLVDCPPNLGNLTDNAPECGTPGRCSDPSGNILC
jgi:chromosome partitioning protein